MDLGTAILLGVLQGLTEFFPISSSGHLALFGTWFGVREPDLTFDILVHLATLAAIIIYFRRDWIQLIRLLVRGEHGDLPKGIFIYLACSVIPAGLIGILAKDQVTQFHDHPAWVGICLFVTGTALLLGLRLGKEGKSFEEMPWAVVVFMALAQALAILPGISRAGATIMTALFLGMDRFAAARYSFLMAVPVIAGAGLLTLIDLFRKAETVSNDAWLAYGVGSLAAIGAGFFALVFLMRFLEGKRFFYFGFYCFVLGFIALLTG